MSPDPTSPDAGRRDASGVLVIGYGNVLRSDDGVGWHAAALLAEDPRLAGATVMARHQLTPELALDVAAASLVILIDAQVGPAPGTIEVRRIGAGVVGTATDTDPGTSSHHVAVEDLLALAGELGGHVPETVVIGIGVADLELGEELSVAVASALPAIVETVVRFVEGRP